MMNQMMQETLLTGTAHKAELPGWQAAGKTGTSQEWRDAWFVGYTSYLVAGVWLGNDDNSPTKKVSGGNLPVEIWSRFMKAAHQGVPVAELPSGVWRNADAPAAESAPPAPPPEAVGAPLAIGRGVQPAPPSAARADGRARARPRRLGRPRAAGLDPQCRQLCARRTGAARQEPARQAVRGDLSASLLARPRGVVRPFPPCGGRCHAERDG